MLASAVLLCAAAEAGDYGEVVRLMSSTDVSPNARGLGHKNSLHLAAAKGHTQIVRCLLMNGVCGGEVVVAQWCVVLIHTKSCNVMQHNICVFWLYSR